MQHCPRHAQGFRYQQKGDPMGDTAWTANNHTTTTTTTNNTNNNNDDNTNTNTNDNHKNTNKDNDIMILTIINTVIDFS